jgi:hypothetical protein
MLRALGYRDIERFNMNEGHAALLTVRFLTDEAKKGAQGNKPGWLVDRWIEGCIEESRARRSEPMVIWGRPMNDRSMPRHPTHDATMGWSERAMLLALQNVRNFKPHAQ